MSALVPASGWKLGHRHCVTGREGPGWRCVWCRRWFETWPSDDEACPGPADPDMPRYGNKVLSETTEARHA